MSRHFPRKYDWFVYGVWFVFGALLSGLPVFVFHFALEMRAMSGWQVLGLLSVCCLAGGLYGGRKHRRQWEHENLAGKAVDDVLNNRR